MSNTQMTHKYIPRISQREENLFLEEYYSGTDTKVYLNGNEQTEISYISFSLNEQLKPIYGYTSRTFDDMAVGSRIVTGVFKMPIVNPKNQDSYETVLQGQPKSTLEEIEEMNQAEEDKKNNTEWTETPYPELDPNEKEFSDHHIFEYQTKLQKLGYDVSCTGYYDDKTIAAIKRFQTDYDLQIRGTFDYDTLNQIDLVLELKKTPMKIAQSKIDVYAGATTSSGVVFNLMQGEPFYLVQKISNYYLIRTTSGKQGYIEASKVPEA